MNKKTLCWSAAVCALAGSLALAVPGTAATAAPSKTAAYPAVGGRLYGVIAPGPNDVWAVGLTGGTSLIMHWNGSAWSQYLTTPGYFNGAGASSPRDVWAVGGTNWFSPNGTLAWHWNGRHWTKVATPSPAGGGYFNAVTATSATNAWAVGLAAPGGPGVRAASTTPLIEHWNGKHWTIQSVQVPAAGGQFTSVSATSSSNAWAVGYTGGSGVGTNQQTLIEHWNGRNWTRVPTPAPGTDSFLQAVTAISGDNAWAVGRYGADGTGKTLVLEWNGKHWTQLPSPTPGGDASLLGVTATWTHNIWAVGFTNPSRCGHGPSCQTLIMHWNSVRWKVIPSPNPPSAYLNLLWAAVAVSRTSIWAVGTTDYNSTLIAHWNGTSWS